MELETKKLLHDVVAAREAILEFTAGKDIPAYEKDHLLRSGVERQFEIIGEALNRLSNRDPETDYKISSLNDIIGFRNRIIHGYDNVDDLIVWNTIHANVVPLKDEVLNLLE